MEKLHNQQNACTRSMRRKICRITSCETKTGNSRLHGRHASRKSLVERKAKGKPGIKRRRILSESCQKCQANFSARTIQPAPAVSILRAFLASTMKRRPTTINSIGSHGSPKLATRLRFKTATIAASTKKKMPISRKTLGLTDH